MPDQKPDPKKPSPLMGLSVWDTLGDGWYDHTNLAENFKKMDAHDMQSGRGVQHSAAIFNLRESHGRDMEKISNDLNTLGAAYNAGEDVTNEIQALIDFVYGCLR